MANDKVKPVYKVTFKELGKKRVTYTNTKDLDALRIIMFENGWFSGILCEVVKN